MLLNINITAKSLKYFVAKYLNICSKIAKLFGEKYLNICSKIAKIYVAGICRIWKSILESKIHLESKIM